ncbi:Methyltransferase-like protein 22 [Collichthys lucidus]|uniref:Methyltransferase-like protein 22 n=1 Tax=Collichthys lucidus TaxID=240159 RepID=A0A4U5VIK2_COLLU|nr:Methyltransferase-like protein 22 [Collichthys lucidus]
MAQLDVHSSQLIKVICAKGGATRQKIANIMDTLDQDCEADGVQRDLEQIYVERVLRGKLPNPKTKSFETVKNSTKDCLFIPKVMIFNSIAREITPFLTLYQTDAPLPQRGYASADERTKACNRLRSDKKVSEREALELKKECKTFLNTTLSKLQSKAPVNHQLVRSMQCLNPRRMALSKEACLVQMKRMLHHLVEANHIEESICDDVLREFANFCDFAALQATFREFDPKTDRVDTLLYETMGTSKSFANVWHVVKMLLVLSHGQASVKRGFSINKELVVHQVPHTHRHTHHQHGFQQPNTRHHMRTHTRTHTQSTWLSTAEHQVQNTKTHTHTDTDSDTEFCWTEDEVADLYNNTSFIIAADVCYDDDLTDGLFRTLYRLCSNFHHTCTIIISLERSYCSTRKVRTTLLHTFPLKPTSIHGFLRHPPTFISYSNGNKPPIPAQFESSKKSIWDECKSPVNEEDKEESEGESCTPAGAVMHIRHVQLPPKKREARGKGGDHSPDEF